MVAAPALSDLPPSCRLVPIVPDDVAPVRLCAVVQLAPDGKESAQLVLLNSIAAGRVYLGALTDRGGRVREWLELWVQVTSGLPASISARETTLTNATLDVRWRDMAAGFIATDPSASWQTGWESKHPAPVWLNVAEGRAVHAVDAGAGTPFTLCTDDATLMVAGLEPYSESLHRYLWISGEPGAGLIAATKDAPLPANARELSDVLPEAKDLLALNPEGGLMFVRRLAPLEWTQYADVLSGRPFSGLAAGRPPVKLGGPFAALDHWDTMQQEGAYIFAQRTGRSGRFLETLHLKLRLLVGMMQCVRSMVAKHQLPMIGLSTYSFRVGFSTPVGNLPILWTASVMLT
jgi:hypothetical protein